LTKAKADYSHALQIQPRQTLAANNLAYLMLENGSNVDVALTYAQTARQGLPDSPDTADTLAWAYYYKGTYEFARDLLEEAVKAQPNNALMQYHLGMVYRKLSDKNGAQSHLKRAIALEPNSPTAKSAQVALNGVG
jgi:Flp pilus assembly protein TadD